MSCAHLGVVTARCPAAGQGLRGMPQDRQPLGAPPDVPDVRSRGLRDSSPNRHATAHFHETGRDRALDRARGVVVLVLRGRGRGGVSPVHVVGYAGSLRAASFNRALLRAAERARAREHGDRDRGDRRDRVYNADVEAQGDPEADGFQAGGRVSPTGS